MDKATVTELLDAILEEYDLAFIAFHRAKAGLRRVRTDLLAAQDATSAATDATDDLMQHLDDGDVARAIVAALKANAATRQLLKAMTADGE